MRRASLCNEAIRTSTPDGVDVTAPCNLPRPCPWHATRCDRIVQSVNRNIHHGLRSGLDGDTICENVRQLVRRLSTS